LREESRDGMGMIVWEVAVAVRVAYLSRREITVVLPEPSDGMLA